MNFRNTFSSKGCVAYSLKLQLIHSRFSVIILHLRISCVRLALTQTLHLINSSLGSSVCCCSWSKTNRGVRGPSGGQQSCYSNVSLPCLYGCTSVFMVWSSACVGSPGCWSIQSYTMIPASIMSLKYSLNPVFITSPVHYRQYSTLVQSCQISGFWGPEPKIFCINLHQPANNSIMVRCLTLRHINFYTGSHLHVGAMLNLAVLMDMLTIDRITKIKMYPQRMIP